MVLTLIMFRKQGKGDCPRLQLKIYYRINKIRSAVCTFRNKNEVLYEVPKPKFDRAALVKNVNRIKIFLPKRSTITEMRTPTMILLPGKLLPELSSTLSSTCSLFIIFKYGGSPLLCSTIWAITIYTKKKRQVKIVPMLQK